jgi:hypothetical protein
MLAVIFADGLDMRLAEEAPNSVFHCPYGTGASIVNPIDVEPLPERCYAATCSVRGRFINHDSYSLNGTAEPLETV